MSFYVIRQVDQSDSRKLGFLEKVSLGNGDGRALVMEKSIVSWIRFQRKIY